MSRLCKPLNRLGNDLLFGHASPTYYNRFQELYNDPKIIHVLKKVSTRFDPLIIPTLNMRDSRETQFSNEFCVKKVAVKRELITQMFFTKEDFGSLLILCTIRARFRSWDLWVMGPPRFRCATLMQLLRKDRSLLFCLYFFQ